MAETGKKAMELREETARNVWFEATCACCGEITKSEKSLFLDSKPITGPEHKSLHDEFKRRLEQRGWNLKPIMCKKCLDELVLKNVGRAFEKALAEKAGEGK